MTEPHLYDLVLKNWESFHEFLPTLREDQVMDLFNFEADHKRRKSFLVRLHQRFNTLRMDRERKEILESLGVDIKEKV